eukprot:2227195-Pyramimonas_sp.AAC.1
MHVHWDPTSHPMRNNASTTSFSPQLLELSSAMSPPDGDDELAAAWAGGAADAHSCGHCMPSRASSLTRLSKSW